MLLQSERVSEMHFSVNSKETESLGKNGCTQKCFDKSLFRFQPSEEISDQGQH